MSRKGKIARLPVAIRDELNRRLLDGQSGGKILPWLNALPETKAVLDEDFDGLPVRDQNLSEWRLGGFKDWVKRREKLDTTRELSQFAADLTKAGNGSLSDGAAAIAAGKLLEVLEGLGEETPSPETLDALTLALSRLRSGDHVAEKLRLTTLRLDQTGALLDLEQKKFQRLTCDLFLKWREDERARNIADGPGTNDEKIDQLGQAMFGELWGKS